MTRPREAGVITERRARHGQRRNAARDKVIRVDDFPYDFGPARRAGRWNAAEPRKAA